MKKSKILKNRCLSAVLAAMLAMTSLLPAYAQEPDVPEQMSAVPEAEDSQPEPLGVLEDSEPETSAPAAEDGAAENTEEETKEETETQEDTEDSYDPYIVYLPVYDFVDYEFDTEAYDAELSGDDFRILLYEEGEEVAFTVFTDTDFTVIDALTNDVYADAGIEDGEVSFSMPAKDLALQFDGQGLTSERIYDMLHPEEADPAGEQDETQQAVQTESVETDAAETDAAETDAVETDAAETDAVETEAPELTQTEGIPTETEPVAGETELSAETEISTEEETEISTEEETEISTEEETELVTEEETEPEAVLTVTAQNGGGTVTVVDSEGNEVVAACGDDAVLETGLDSSVKLKVAADPGFLIGTMDLFNEVALVGSADLNGETEFNTTIDVSENMTAAVSFVEITDEEETEVPDDAYISTITYDTRYVWTGDYLFDPADMVFEDYFDKATESWAYESGTVNLDGIGNTYPVTYRVTAIADPETYRFAVIPFVPVSNRDDVSVRIEEAKAYTTGIVNTEGFSGKIPEFAGETIDLGELTVIAGSGTALDFLTLGYDPDRFAVTPLNWDDVDLDEPGDYNAKFDISAYENSDCHWYVTCQIHVVDKIQAQEGVSVYLETAAFTGVITKADGNTDDLYFGKIFQSDDAIQHISLKLTHGKEVNPLVSVYCDGKKVSAEDFLSEEKGTDTWDADIRGLELPEHSYVFAISFDSWDPTENGEFKAGGGWETNVPEDSYYLECLKSVGLLDEDGALKDLPKAELESKFAQVQEMLDNRTTPVATANKPATFSINGKTAYMPVQTALANQPMTIATADKTKTFSMSTIPYNKDSASTASCWDHGDRVYNGMSANISSIIPSMNTFLSDNNVQLQEGSSVPAYIWLYCNFHGGAGLHGYENLYGSVTATIRYKNDEPYLLYIAVHGYNSSGGTASGYQSFFGSANVPIGPAMGSLVIRKAYKNYASWNGKGINFYNSTSRVMFKASFGVYTKKNCNPDSEVTILTIPNTAMQEDGDIYYEAKVYLPEDTYFVKEIDKPDGMIEIPDVIRADVKNGETTYVSNADSKRWINEPFRVTMPTLAKKEDSASGTPVANAIFVVKYYTYTPGNRKSEQMYRWFFKTGTDGNLVYDKAHYVKTWNNIDSDKLIYFGDNPCLPVGTITIREVEAPEPYTVNTKTFTIDLKTQSDKTQPRLQFTAPTVEEDGYGYLKLHKTDAKTGGRPDNANLSLVGAEYSVYGDAGCSDKVGTLTVQDEDGNTNTLKLTIGTYYVKETKAPKGYALDTTVNQVSITKDHTEVAPYVLQTKDNPDEGRITVQKYIGDDYNSGPLSSKYSFAGAVYGVFPFENSSPDDCITEIRINGETSIGTSDPLPLGTYWVWEISVPSCGVYAVDETKHRVEVKLDNVGKVYATPVYSEEQPVPASITIQKELEGMTDADLQKLYDSRILEGIEFTLTHENAGSIGFELGRRTGKTDRYGRVTFNDLVAGTWIVTENNPPVGYGVIKNSKIEVEPGGSGSTTFSFEDKVYHGYIEIYKKDSLTGEVIPRDDVYFRIENRFGDTVTLNVKGQGKTEQFHTVGGQITFEDPLPGGEYKLYEVAAPEGYKLSSEPVAFSILADGSPEHPIELVLEDTPVSTEITLEKKDSVTKGSAGAGFTFNLVADEDVVDSAGKARTGYSKDTVLEKLTTQADGTVRSTVPLYPGKYRLEEESAAYGYQKTENVIKFTVKAVKNGNDWNAVVESDALSGDHIVVEDAPVMRPIEVLKKDAVTGNPAGAGFTFEVIAQKVVDGSGAERAGFEKGTVVDTITTDHTGTARSKDLYVGSYTVREIGRAEGYVLNGEEFTVEVTDDNKTTEPVVLTVEDQPLKKRVSVKKLNEVTGNACGAGYVFQIVAAEDCVDASGAVYEGYAKDSVVDTITTGADGVATSKELYLGKYYIQEIKVADKEGMALNSRKYPFELTDEHNADGSLKPTEEQTLLVELDAIPDKPTTLFLYKVDTEVGKPLAGITFRIRPIGAKESNDQLFVTDEDGLIRVEYLERDTTYSIQEVETIPGYNLNDEIYEFTVDENGLIDGEAYYYITITNKPNVVSFSKVDVTTSEELPGAHLVLTDSEGHVVDEWDSGEEPHIILELPAGIYRLTETIAPDLYELESSIEFEVKDSLVVQKVVMKDSPYRDVEISKQDIADSSELPGCTLTVRDAQNNIIETWVSGTEPHKMKLPSGLYTLTEDIPAAGFVTSSTITFEVIKTTEDDFLVQHVTMVDDVTKLQISKKDVTTGDELPGAKLTITDSEGNVVDEWVSGTEPHYVERLPMGKYTLTEVTAPDGYETAESIEFEILDTGEIQHVEMFDSPYRDVEVSKQDITDSREIPGAHLEIRDSEGDVVDEWISEAEPHMSHLPAGKYTLTETLPADGYVTADTIEFEVIERSEEGDFDIQHVEMFDDVTKVEISKQDVTTEKELPGASLRITDSEGKTVDEWVSGTEPHYIEKLPIGKYTLTEVTAPDGYEIAESIEFEIFDSGEIQHVLMYDSPTPEKTVPMPKTGDDFNVPLMAAIIIAVIALLAAGVVLLVKSRKKKE